MSLMMPRYAGLKYASISRQMTAQRLRISGSSLDTGDYWLEFPLTWSDDDSFPGYGCKGCLLVTLDDLEGLGLESFKELIGEVWGAGPKDLFPTGPAGDDDDDASPGDDDDDSGSGGDGDDDDDSSGGGCNVGFAAKHASVRCSSGPSWSEEILS